MTLEIETKLVSLKKKDAIDHYMDFLRNLHIYAFFILGLTFLFGGYYKGLIANKRRLYREIAERKRRREQGEDTSDEEDDEEAEEGEKEVEGEDECEEAKEGEGDYGIESGEVYENTESSHKTRGNVNDEEVNNGSGELKEELKGSEAEVVREVETNVEDKDSGVDEQGGRDSDGGTLRASEKREITTPRKRRPRREWRIYR